MKLNDEVKLLSSGNLELMNKEINYSSKGKM